MRGEPFDGGRRRRPVAGLHGGGDGDAVGPLRVRVGTQHLVRERGGGVHRAADQLELVRISFGAYNDSHDVDRVADALEQVAAGAVRGIYRQGGGAWAPVGDRELAGR
jgi:hypothetical protein